ncbi:MAG: NAD(P)/FAD-dependent oxidoreductase [Halobacterium sp.]
MSDADVVVVGGGLAGLVAARRLAADGFDVTLFEREPRTGGRVRSVHADGYTFDRGFQVLFTAYPAARRELEFDALDLRSFSPGAVLCRGDRRATLGDPFRDPGSLVPTLLNREISAVDKVRTLRLRADLARTSIEDVFESPDATIEQYLASRGFSDRYVDRFVRPFYGGITLDRDLETSKRVFEFTFKLLAEGAAAVPADGMGAVSRQLAERAQDAGVTVETDTTVRAVDEHEPSVEVPGETVTADAVVVAADPKTSRELTGVDAVPTDARGCVTQYYALPENHPIADSDRLHLNAGGAVPNTVAPMSGVAPEYAPGDRALVAATAVGSHEHAGPERDPTSHAEGALRLSDGDLETQVRDALASWYPEATVADAQLLRTDRIEFAQFAQPPGVHETLPDVRDPDGMAYLAGDYTQSSSIQGALESGATAAAAVAEDLQ